MSSGQNKLDNKSDDHLLIVQGTIESSRQDSDKKAKNLTEDLIEMIASMMDQIKILKSSPDKKDSPKAQDPNTVVPDNNKSPPLEGGHYKRMVACGLSNIKSAQQKYINSSLR